MGLGKHRGSRYVGILAVALHYAGKRNVGGRVEAITINGKEFWAHTQHLHRAVHTLKRRLQDVNLVNALRRNLRHSPRHSLTLNYGAQHITLTLGHLL